MLTAILKSFRAAFAAPRAPTELPPAAPMPRLVTPAPSVPRYPPPGPFVPASNAAAIVETQRALIREIEEALCYSGEEYQRLIAPIFLRFAAFVHLLPASKAHHHSAPGGLFCHGVEAAFFAARYTEGSVFGLEFNPSSRQYVEPRMRLAGVIAALLHDVGKAVSDLCVRSPDGSQTWSPFQMSLADWLEGNQLSEYEVTWVPTRLHKQHEGFGMAVAARVIGDDLMAYLHERSEGVVVPQLFAVLMGNAQPDNPLKRVVDYADRTSVARDLRQASARLRPEGGTAQLFATRVLSAMSRLVSEGLWKPNHGNHPLFWTELGLVLRYPDGVAAVLAHMRSQGDDEVPQEPTLVRQALEQSGNLCTFVNSQGEETYVWALRLQLGQDAYAAMRTVDIRGLLFVTADQVLGAATELGRMRVEVIDDSAPAATPASNQAPAPAGPSTPAEPGTKPTAGQGQLFPQPPPPAQPLPAPTDVPTDVPWDASDDPPTAGEGAGEGGGVVIRDRRAEADPADHDRGALKRAMQRDLPKTREEIVHWLGERGRAGIYLLEILQTLLKPGSMLKWGTDFDTHDGRVVMAHPEVIAQLGSSIGRVTKELEPFIERDPNTPDKGTVMAVIAGKSRLALRFTAEVSILVETYRKLEAAGPALAASEPEPFAAAADAPDAAAATAAPEVGSAALAEPSERTPSAEPGAAPQPINAAAPDASSREPIATEEKRLSKGQRRRQRDRERELEREKERALQAQRESDAQRGVKAELTEPDELELPAIINHVHESYLVHIAAEQKGRHMVNIALRDWIGKYAHARLYSIASLFKALTAGDNAWLLADNQDSQRAKVCRINPKFVPYQLGETE